MTDQTGPDLERGFDDAAARYDLLTALNPGYHCALAGAARAVVAHRPEPTVEHPDEPTAVPADEPAVLLDLGCGSGLSTRALLDAADEGTRVIGIDASAGMLAQARAKTWPAGVSFVQGRAQDLPAILTGQGIGQVDGILAAYLLRNVPAEERDAALRAMHDALAPGTPLVLHEYSVTSRSARVVWTLVCRGIVLPLARVTRANPDLYRYLWRSGLEMDGVDVVERRLRDAGFTDVRSRTVPGWTRGILHTISARRPDHPSPGSPPPSSAAPTPTSGKEAA